MSGFEDARLWLTVNAIRSEINEFQVNQDSEVDVDEFNESLVDNVRNNNCLSYHSSLASNFDRMLSLLPNVHLKFSCIGVSETWLQNSFHNCQCDIPDYNFVHSLRLNKVGGGN